MKTAQVFRIYLLGHSDRHAVKRVLADLGLESEHLTDPAKVVHPALILAVPGHATPEGMGDITIALPTDASPAALRELLRVAMANVALKQQVKQLDEQGRRLHPQFAELNRTGTGVPPERDNAKPRALTPTTMRRRTTADGPSLWLKSVGDNNEPMLFLA